MERPFSRRNLVFKLMGRGVRPGYAWRVSGELADHAEDISEGKGGRDARLGDVNELLAQIVQGYRQRTFAGRHPILTFAVAPLPLMIFAMIGYWIAGGLVLYMSTKVTNCAGIVALVVQFGSTFLPSMFLTRLICRHARGAGLNWKKATLACLPILLFAFVVSTWVRLHGYAHGAFGFGLNLPLGGFFGSVFGPPTWWPPMIWTPLGRVALPVCVILLMYVRERRQAREIVLQSVQSWEGSSAANTATFEDSARAA